MALEDSLPTSFRLVLERPTARPQLDPIERRPSAETSHGLGFTTGDVVMHRDDLARL